MERIAVYASDPDKAALAWSDEGFSGFACNRLDRLLSMASSGVNGVAVDIPLVLHGGVADKERLNRLMGLLPSAVFRLLDGSIACSTISSFREDVGSCRPRFVREHERKSLMCPVTVDGKRCVTRDVSPAGAFVIHGDPPEVGSTVRFATDLSGRHLTGIAKVVWRRTFEEAGKDLPPGMGIRFCNYRSPFDGDVGVVTEF